MDNHEEGLVAINGSEVLSRFYELLRQANVEVKFPDDEKVKTLIADDSDGHRTRRGYSVHESFMIINEKWLASLGNKSRSYTTDLYDKDLFLLSIQQDEISSFSGGIVSYARYNIENAEYFRHSVLLSVSDGRLYVAPWLDLNFRDRIAKSIMQHRLKAAEYREDVIMLSSLSYLNTKKAQYSTNLPTELFNIFQEMLV